MCGGVESEVKEGSLASLSSVVVAGRDQCFTTRDCQVLGARPASIVVYYEPHCTHISTETTTIACSIHTSLESIPISVLLP